MCPADVLRFRVEDAGEGERIMVIDYREARDAIAAETLAARAGIVAVYIPDKWVQISDDPTLTMWLAQRLHVSPSDEARAAALLEEYDLRGEPPRECA